MEASIRTMEGRKEARYERIETAGNFDEQLQQALHTSPIGANLFARETSDQNLQTAYEFPAVPAE